MHLAIYLEYIALPYAVKQLLLCDKDHVGLSKLRLMQDSDFRPGCCLEAHGCIMACTPLWILTKRIWSRKSLEPLE